MLLTRRLEVQSFYKLAGTNGKLISPLWQSWDDFKLSIGKRVFLRDPGKHLRACLGRTELDSNKSARHF